MATALHPQTILATKYAGEPITDPFGFPLRLRTATKLGFKNPKWITAIEVTNTYPRRLLGGPRLQLVQRHLMALPFNVALGALAAAAVWTVTGLALTRRLFPSARSPCRRHRLWGGRPATRRPCRCSC